ncbi:MAG: hypothetical protein M1812_006607 [Candelaria pacifica]|nr:MAG: hypothetical protein M1812_006607 [Candelaria pacifica]
MPRFARDVLSDLQYDMVYLRAVEGLVWRIIALRLGQNDGGDLCGKYNTARELLAAEGGEDEETEWEEDEEMEGEEETEGEEDEEMEGEEEGEDEDEDEFEEWFERDEEEEEEDWDEEVANPEWARQIVNALNP